MESSVWKGRGGVGWHDGGVSEEIQQAERRGRELRDRIEWIPLNSLVCYWCINPDYCARGCIGMPCLAALLARNLGRSAYTWSKRWSSTTCSKR